MLKDKIKQARLDSGMTQRELAEKVGAIPQTIMKYEKGLRNPKIDMIQKIAQATGKEITYFLEV